MDRRLFLLLLVAGCADTSTEFKPVTGSPFPAPEPHPPRPDLPSAPPGSSGDASFDEWRGQFRNRALAAGLVLDRPATDLGGVGAIHVFRRD